MTIKTISIIINVIYILKCCVYEQPNAAFLNNFHFPVSSLGGMR